MSAELKAEDRDWNLDRVERFLQERNAEVVGEGLSEFDDETYQLARDLKKSKKSRMPRWRSSARWSGMPITGTRVSFRPARCR
jgi:hypothetical protein